MALMISLQMDDAALSNVATILGVVTALISQIDDAKWGRDWTRRRQERERRQKLVGEWYSRRPTLELYRLVSKMALEHPVASRRARYAMRAQKVLELDPEDRQEAEQAAILWLETVGELAKRSRESRLPLRYFLATYHLGVMREGVIAIPIAVTLLASHRLDEGQRQKLFWGAALLDLAARYNSVARQQRDPVFFASKSHEPAVGPVRNPPRRIVVPYLNLVDHLSSVFRLRIWRYVWCRCWISRVSGALVVPPAKIAS
jgi:hypothetical protein